LSSASRHNFEYIWIVRCVGSNNINQNVECKIVNDAPEGIFPLIEVINEQLFVKYVSRFRSKYGKVMVDVPSYLVESSSRYYDAFQNFISNNPNPLNFYKKYQSIIDIPVISTQSSGDMKAAYNLITTNLQQLQPFFKQIAVRIKVHTVDLTSTPEIVTAYKDLIKSMRPTDLILFEIFDISRMEHAIQSNLNIMCAQSGLYSLKGYVLNAFNPVDNGHNYGPLFSYKLQLSGFGDFATEKRFPSRGGTSPNRIIRYYYWNKFLLKEHLNSNYTTAINSIKSNHFWTNNIPTHRLNCRACDIVENASNYNQGSVFWKRFRVLHYLNCIQNETKTAYSQAACAEDLDPDGHDTLYNLDSA